ncbi:MAG: hypothetical protein HQM14_07410 [SAR324 cluster bacterium]|nr:hypothetical protein [SAR324 cluster bacterium]
MRKEQKDVFRKEVGEIVERFRLEKGYSRRKLGEALGYQGNSAVQVVARIESGRAGIPKSKIDQLVQILGISNKNFGLSSTKSLKNFISAGGFLGTPGKLLGTTIVDMMDANDAKTAREALEDDEENGSNDQNNYDRTDYFDISRLMKIYRIQKPSQSYSMIEKVNIIDDLADGDNEAFLDILATLDLVPDEVYQAIEEKLTEILKPGATAKPVSD